TLNSTTGATTPDVFFISQPGVSTGSETVSSFSRLWGLDAGFVRNLATNGCWRADLLFGFRYIDLNEDLNIDRTTTTLVPDSVSFLAGTLPAGSLLIRNDRFAARN